MTTLQRPMTTGQVAAFFGVSNGTVRRWANRGLLNGWKIPGGGGHRRFSREVVEQVAEDYNIPTLVTKGK